MNNSKDTKYPQIPVDVQTESLSSEGQSKLSPEALRQQRMIMLGIIVGGIIILAVIVVGIVFLVSPRTDTPRVRDIFIIFMALESLIIGLVLIILVIQLARLINLLQNEIKPILDSTNETVNTLRGTTTFISDNLTEPVIKLNEYLAGVYKFLKLIRPARSKRETNND